MNVTTFKAVSKDEQAKAVSLLSSDDSASGSNPTSSDDERSHITGTSSSVDGHGPLGRPHTHTRSPPSGSSPSSSSSESHLKTRKRVTVPNKREERVPKVDRIKVIRMENSYFKTTSGCRTFFLI